MNEPCWYYLLCDRAADGTTEHPALGAILTCRPCAQATAVTLVETAACHDGRTHRSR